MRQKLIDVRREIVRFTYIVGDFDTTQSVTDKPSRQKISKDLVEWNSIINQLDLNDNYRIPVVQLLSHVWLFSTPWTEACQASLFFTISQRLFKLMSIESVMPSNHLIFFFPLLLLPLIFPSIGVFSNESALCIRRYKLPKYWSFSFSIRLSNEYSGLIYFMMDWLDLLAVQGTLKSLLQHHSSKASVLLHSAFFIVQFSHPHMTTGKTLVLTRWNLVGK